MTDDKTIVIDNNDVVTQQISLKYNKTGHTLLIENIRRDLDKN